MLFKLILSHVIFEPRYSMIANRTIQPSCRSLKTGARRNVPLTSSFCCCSLKLKDTGLVARFYSTQGYQDGTKTRDSLGRQCLKSMDTSERETLRQRLNAFARQDRKSSSIRRFEPCYRQIYPSKKRKATFKIPKKPPYIPAVYQKKTTSYRDKYSKMDLEPVKGRRLQWPQLYPSKRKDYPHPSQSQDKSNELPPWLLPLYSCKTCHKEDAPSTSEARFSGGAFHRKMEIAESIKQIRANQDVLLARLHQKETKKDESTQHLTTSKSANAVEALKRKINSMHDYLSAMKNMEAYRNKYQPQKTVSETKLAEEPVPVRQPYARIYQTKPPTQDQEVRVRKSMGLGVVGPKKPLTKPLPGTTGSVTLENAKDVDNNKRIHTPKMQCEDSVKQNPEAELNSTKQMVVDKCLDAEGINNLSLGQIHKESVVMIKQPSWKKHPTSNNRTNNVSITGENKTQILNSQTNTELTTNQIRASPKQRQPETINDTSMTNRQSRNIKIQENKAVHGNKAADAWTVESLKSRINVMKIKSTLDEPGTKKLDDMSLTRNGGEIKPKISQVALRSFHKEAGSKIPRNPQASNTIKPRLGYQRTVSRRNFSTFRALTSEQPAKRGRGCYRRTIFNAPPNMNKKRSWVNRLKKCLVLKKIKGSKCENWKEAPREIPYTSEEVKYNSPAPILWKPLELDINLEKQPKPHETVFREKVNPAVLNAEQRILASISRLISTKPQSDIPDVRVTDIENKIKRANNKVNMMPWLKRSKSTDKVQTLPQLRGSYNKLEKDEPRESGYEWILRNRDMVEELKRQSRYAAGKTLVPTDVKNSINQYKLPLKGEISRYRKKLDQKCSEQLYMYSSSKRWYSTCFAGKHRGILSCSDVILVNTRGIKTTGFQKENLINGRLPDRRTRSHIALGPNLRHYNQGAHNNHRKIDEPIENPAEEKRPNRWTWKVPNKTRTFTPKTTTLTSPSKTTGTRMSEMSPCALKKQVEELKRLIKKAREEGAEKTDDELPIDPQSGDKYEARLKRLVKAAHNNAEKMQIVEPKYTSENNMMPNKPSSGKRNSSQPMTQYDTKSVTPKYKPEVSVLKSLFKKTKGESKTLADEILYRNNLTSLPALAYNKKPEKPISRVYLKLKSLVEAVRKKSALLDPISNEKLLPSTSLKGSVSADAILPLSKSIVEKSGKPVDASVSEYACNDTSPVTVGLLAEKTPAPSNTIQLWKGEPKPKEFNFVNDKEPTYGDLLTLFSKAKGLFYYQPPEDKTTDGKCPTAEMHTNSSDNNIVAKNEMTKSWLSIREDVSNAARAVSELKNDPQRETLQASSDLFTLQQNESAMDNLSEYMMSKSKMIPFELLRPEPKITCDHMWASVPVKILEDEDLYRKPTVENNPINENRSASQPNVESTSLPTIEEICPKTVNDNLASQTKLWQPESKTDQQGSQKLVCLEPTKPSLPKRMITLGSLTKNFGSGVGSILGKVAGSPNNADTEAAGSNKNPRTNNEPKTGDVFNSSGEISDPNYPEIKYLNDINMQSHSTLGGNVISNCSHVADNIQELTSVQNATMTKSSDEQSNQSGIKDCIESFRPLEGKVKAYENYYRTYFTEDIISGYEHLHQAYDGLTKLNTGGQYQSLENPFNIGTETKKEAYSQLISNTNASTSVSHERMEETKAPIKVESGIITDLKSHGSAELQSGGLTEAKETNQAQPINHQGITAITTPGTQASSFFGGVSESGGGRTIVQQHEANKPASAIAQEARQSESQHSVAESSLNSDNDRHATCNTESFIDPADNIREGIHLQESEQIQMGLPTNLQSYSTRESKDIQPQFNSVNRKEEPANFEDLLTRDPTLNPEVVKKLKLPVILPEDRHTEKNWYTRFYSGTRQNH